VNDYQTCVISKGNPNKLYAVTATDPVEAKWITRRKFLSENKPDVIIESISCVNALMETPF
jgi:ligand-binding SRPBCC domain-containing protein